MQDLLRKAGTFQWNTDINLNKGELIPSRRPNPKYPREAIASSICPTCKGSYSTTNIRHHACGKMKPMKRERIAKALGRLIEGRIHPLASLRYKKVFSKLRDGPIIRLIRYDWLVTVFGNFLCTKYTPDFQEKHVRARLRSIGSLLYVLKQINRSVADLQTVFIPKNYDSVIAAIRIVGRLNETTNLFGAPMTASGIVTNLKDIGNVLIAEYIKNAEPEKKMQSMDFMKVLNSPVGIGISILKAVTDTQAAMKKGKKANIPTTNDVKQLAQYLDIERKNSFETLASTYSYDHWVELLELTMASLIVFNRRRVGETQNIHVIDFTERERVNEYSNKELFAKLSDQAKKLAEQYSRMQVRGKKAREVPVLVKPDIAECIELLLKHRENAGVGQQNPYLFALPSCSEDSMRKVDGCSILRKFSERCGAHNPKSLRGTTMRKHMATFCVGLELNDGVISEIADFMGHDDKIHREIYRQNPLDREIVQMSQLLDTAQGKSNDLVGEIGIEDLIGESNNEDSIGEKEDDYLMGEWDNNNDGYKDNISEPFAQCCNIVKDQSPQFEESTSFIAPKLKNGVIVKSKCTKNSFIKKTRELLLFKRLYGLN